MILMFSTFATWYEGSAIREDPWEWKYSTPFSKWLHGEVTDPSDISGLDHFIYAAKFSPLYPTLILISLSYIIILSGYLLLKNNKRKLSVFLLLISVPYIISGISVSQSPTTGGTYFIITFLTVGIINLVLGLLIFLKTKNGTVQME